jgi:hypothetical protein
MQQTGLDVFPFKKVACFALLWRIMAGQTLAPPSAPVNAGESITLNGSSLAGVTGVALQAVGKPKVPAEGVTATATKLTFTVPSTTAAGVYQVHVSPGHIPDVPLTVSPSASPLTLEGAAVLVVDQTNKGSVVLQLRNTSGKDITLDPSMTDFQSATTKQYLGAASVLSAGDTAAAGYLGAAAKPLPPNKIAAVKLDVTNLWEAGESLAHLLQNHERTADITAIKYRVPFAIRLTTPAADKEDASFSRGKSGSISLKNDDPMTYRVNWTLTVANQTILGSQLDLPPGGAVPLSLTLPCNVFSWLGSGTIQDDIESAKLQLRLGAGGTDTSGGLPALDIPVKLRLHWFNYPWQQLWNVFWIVMMLAAGAAISIALNIGIPNQMKRNEMWNALRDLTRKINSLDSSVGVEVLTLMRVERHRIGDRLESLFWFSPNLAAELPLLQQAIDLFNARLNIADQVAQALVVTRTALVPPVQMDRLTAAARKILDTDTRPDLSPNDLPALAASVGAFQQQIASLGQTDADFEAELLKTEAALKMRIDAARESAPAGGGTGTLKATSEWVPFLPELVGLFDSISQASSTIQLSQYFERDIASQYGDICARYLDTRALIGEPKRAKDLDNAVAQRMKVLFEKRTYANLTKARVLLKTAEQGVLDGQLIEALTTVPPKASVQVVPSHPANFEPAWFEAHFADPTLDTATARERITCEWVFGTSRQQGWRVAHYFVNAGETKVHAEFRDADQNPVLKNKTIVQLPVIVNVIERRRGGHIGLALLRTGLALLVALIALIGGIQDKIATLSLVQALLAILVLGLTADSIKNLLSK